MSELRSPGPQWSAGAQGGPPCGVQGCGAVALLGQDATGQDSWPCLCLGGLHLPLTFPGSGSAASAKPCMSDALTAALSSLQDFLPQVRPHTPRAAVLLVRTGDSPYQCALAANEKKKSETGLSEKATLLALN